MALEDEEAHATDRYGIYNDPNVVCFFSFSFALLPENPKKLKSKRASSGSMVSKQIIQFKCVVSLCDQDFGAFCRERDPEGKKRFGQQPGATKQVAEGLLEALVEVYCGDGGVGWWYWELGAMLEAGGWEAGLRSLLGRLWWHWVFWLAGGFAVAEDSSNS